jgi:hypothetical protein
MLRVVIDRTVRFATLTAVCALVSAAAAQDMPPTPVADSSPQPAATPPAVVAEAPPPVPGPATPAANPLNTAQLEQIVAPVALYPDPLLSQVLMASTYPLEVVEADRWLRDPANQALKGDALTEALKQRNWDPSVMALVPFPRLLALMAERLEWTQQLGNVFLAQQADVMNAVQALRHDALAAGNLKATPQCHCVIQTSNNVISILPSGADVVCIPVYNPKVAYGTWPAPEYPPVFFPPPPAVAFEPGLAVGFYPAIEIAAFGTLWGWGGFDWGHGAIVVDRSRYASLDPHPGFSGDTWVHNAAHRGGVAYGDPAVTSRFGAARVAAMTAAAHTAFVRGASGEHVAVLRGSGGAMRRSAVASHEAFRGASHAEAQFHHGAVGRGPAPVHGGGGHFAHANFAHANFAPHFGGGGHPGGGGHGGGHGRH